VLIVGLVLLNVVVAVLLDTFLTVMANAKEDDAHETSRKASLVCMVLAL